MSNRFSASLVLAGAIVMSSAATYILTKAKYEKKNANSNYTLKRETPKNDIEENKLQDKGSVFDYAKKYKENVKPYVPPEIQESGGVEYVSQDIFDSCEYDDVVYTLWADGVLTDENDRPIADADTNVGIEAIERFNELAVHDSVYVLNHDQRIRYEILKDLRMFAEMVNPIDLE